MLQDSFKKYMALVLFIFGCSANGIGLYSAYKQNTGTVSIIITSICLISIVILFLFSFSNKKYNLFSRIATMFTGMVYFPLILMSTRTPETFLYYTFILPPSYAVSLQKKNELMFPFFNLVIIIVAMYLASLRINTIIIYVVIYIYSTLVTSLLSIISQNYVDTTKNENKTLKKMSERDELTKLYNRHYLNSVMNLKETWVPVMMDIDRFKEVNDNYGHDEGDRVLRQLASILLKCQTEELIPFRYGGEEFIILSKLDEQQTEQAVIEFVNTVRQELHTKDRKPRTISVGIGYRAVLTEESIKDADNNLYLCKENGRNCIARNGQIIYR